LAMKCPNCGTENPDSGVCYCQKCAYEFESETTETKLPELWMLGFLMCMVGIILMGLYGLRAVTGLMAGPMSVTGGALFLAGLITWRVYHRRED
jgi:hypothetical protein